MAGNDERQRDYVSEAKQKVAPKQSEDQPLPKQSSDDFEEETETGKLTGVGAW